MEIDCIHEDPVNVCFLLSSSEGRSAPPPHEREKKQTSPQDPQEAPNERKKTPYEMTITKNKTNRRPAKPKKMKYNKKVQLLVQFGLASRILVGSSC